MSDQGLPILARQDRSTYRFLKYFGGGIALILLQYLPYSGPVLSWVNVHVAALIIFHLTDVIGLGLAIATTKVAFSDRISTGERRDLAPGLKALGVAAISVISFVVPRIMHLTILPVPIVWSIGIASCMLGLTFLLTNRK